MTEKTVEDVAERPEVSGKRSGNAEESTDLRLLQNPSGGDEGLFDLKHKNNKMRRKKK